MDEIVLTQENGAITKVRTYVSSIDGAVIVEVDTDANFDGETVVRVHVNDDLAWNGEV